MIIGHFVASFLTIYSIDNNCFPVIYKIDDFLVIMHITFHKNGLLCSSGSGRIRIITGYSGTLRNKSILNSQAHKSGRIWFIGFEPEFIHIIY
jgi:hypothetical protein